MPSSMADFDSDPRIHFDTVSGKWQIEDDDGNEMEWEPIKQSWIPLVSLCCLYRKRLNIDAPKVDEELLKQQQAVYSVDGVDESVRFLS